MNASFFGELLQAIAERGRALIDRTRDRRGPEARSQSLIDLCEELLSGRGEPEAQDSLSMSVFAELASGILIVAIIGFLGLVAPRGRKGSSPLSMSGYWRSVFQGSSQVAGLPSWFVTW